MKILVAKHKETGTEVLLVNLIIGEGFIKFLNKENAATPILVNKEDFVKYLDVIKKNIDLVNWCKTKDQINTPVQQEMYQEMCNWLEMDLKFTKLNLDTLEEVYYNAEYILRYFDDEDYEIYIS